MLRKFTLEWIVLPVVFVTGTALLGSVAGLATFLAGMNASWIDTLQAEPVSFPLLVLTLSAYVCFMPAAVTASLSVHVKNRFPSRYGFHLALGTLYLLLSVTFSVTDYLRDDLSALYFGVWFTGLFSFLTAFLVSSFLGALVWSLHPATAPSAGAAGADAFKAEAG